MTHPHVPDPWKEADEAQPLTYTHFGAIMCHADYVVWPKGVALRDAPPFDPAQHQQNDKVTRITIAASPLPGRTNPFPHERVMGIYTPEWTKVTLPSLKELGVSGRELNGKWAQYQFKPARNYTNSNGDTKTSTSFHFIALYGSEVEAVKAAGEFFGNGDDAKDEPIPGFEDEPMPWDDKPDNGKGNGSDPQKTALVPFLGPIWATCGGDIDKMAEQIANNPLLAEHFDVKSPEVQAVIAANPTKA